MVTEKLIPLPLYVGRVRVREGERGRVREWERKSFSLIVKTLSGIFSYLGVILSDSFTSSHTLTCIRSRWLPRLSTEKPCWKQQSKYSAEHSLLLFGHYQSTCSEDTMSNIIFSLLTLFIVHSLGVIQTTLLHLSFTVGCWSSSIERAMWWNSDQFQYRTLFGGAIKSKYWQRPKIHIPYFILVFSFLCCVISFFPYK